MHPERAPEERGGGGRVSFFKDSLLHLLLPHVQSLIGLLAFGESIPIS